MKKKKIYLIIPFLILIGVGICILGRYTPFTPDDYNYSNIPWTRVRVTNFNQMLESIKVFYPKWSGRILMLFLSQLFYMHNLWIYTVCNAIMYLVLGYLISKFLSKELSMRRIVLAFTCLFFFTPSFAENFIWICGALNYLWSVTFVIVMCYLYFWLYGPQKMEMNLKKRKLLQICLIVISFVAGFYHENATFLGGAFGVVFIILNWKNIIKFTKGDKVNFGLGVLAFGLGCAALLLAPGNFNRANGSGGVSLKLSSITQIFNEQSWIIVVSTAVVMLIILAIMYRFCDDYKEKVSIILKYIYLPAILSILPMLFLGEFPNRALLAYISFVFIMSVDILDYLLSKISSVAMERGIVLTVSLLLISAMGGVSYYYLTVVRDYDIKTTDTISFYEKVENRDVLINRLEIPDILKERYVVHEINLPGTFANTIAGKYMSDYYGMNTIRTIRKNTALVTLDIENEKKIDCTYELYYDDFGKWSDLNRVNRIYPYDIMPGEENKNLGEAVFEIPATALAKIRIDFPQNKKNIRIKGIKIEGLGYKRYLTATELIQKTTYANQFENGKIEDGVLIIDTKEDTFLKVIDLLGEN